LDLELERLGKVMMAGLPLLFHLLRLVVAVVLVLLEVMRPQ
jgi:uncharacterized membrane protein YqjE